MRRSEILLTGCVVVKLLVAWIQVLGSAFACFEPITDGTFNLAGFRKVVRQQFGLARHAIR